jgi:Domain of unknown function (DUF6456)
MHQGLSASAERHLLALATGRPASMDDDDVEELIAHDHVSRHSGGRVDVTRSGRAYLARRQAARDGLELDPFIAQHLDPVQRAPDKGTGDRALLVDGAESPLAWLARRKSRDGQPLIAPEQLQAGERLRAEFTRAQMTPRVTANWTASISQGRRGGGGTAFMSDVVVAARQRVRSALEAVGPEFAGLLLDVCCFLKGLEHVERERKWPPRSAKLVLQLGLDRLARHYGLAREAKGPAHGAVQTWLAPDAKWVVDDAKAD